MNLSITFFNGEDLTAGKAFDFSVEGFMELVETGVFKLPHCIASNGARSVDLGIFQVRVKAMIESLVTHHPRRRALVESVERYRYLTADY